MGQRHIGHPQAVQRRNPVRACAAEARVSARNKRHCRTWLQQTDFTGLCRCVLILRRCRRWCFVLSSVDINVRVTNSRIYKALFTFLFLFLLYINDITKDISSDIHLFADDCILYRVIRTQSDCIALQADIDRLYSWVTRWQMQSNAV